MRVVRVLILLVAALTTLTAIAAPNIFDDGWKPPARRTTPTTPTPKPPDPTPTGTTEPPSVPKTKPPIVTPTPIPEKPARNPIPSQADQSHSRTLFREVFKSELNDRSAPARRALAEKLLSEADRLADNRSDQYVLLAGAHAAAKDAADLPLCFRAADRMANSFEVDPLGLKIDAANNITSKGPIAAAAAAVNISAALPLIDALVADGDLDGAIKLANALAVVAVASGDMLRPLLAARVKELTLIKGTRERLLRSAGGLPRNPQDPAANLAAGSYFCFFAGDWSQGLPLLVKGNDAALKSLASAELALPKVADDAAILRVADDWWTYAEKQQPPNRAPAARHAADLYRRVAPAGITGLNKVRVERRLASLASFSGEAGGYVNLIALVEVANDTVAGNWEMRDGGRIVAKNLKTPNARLQLPYVPPAEYDFRIVFTRTGGDDTVAQICAAAGTQFTWWNGGWGNTVMAFGLIDGKLGDANATTNRSAGWLTNGQRYVSIVKVRKNRVEAYLDGRQLGSWKTNYADMKLDAVLNLTRTDTLGIHTHLDDVEVDLADLVEVDGQGRPIR
ncbi:MAG: hypothetical protein JWN40_2769 [Phycisphaerales bacterium]|nr:hypothetical protein [Phycisphaerales bacterium]